MRRPTTLCLTTTGVLVAAAAAHADPVLQSVRGVRAVQPRAERLLEDAITRSITVQRQVDALASSDLIVYLHVAPTVRVRSACLRLMAAGPNVRYVQVIVNSMRPRDDLVGLLAHELHHALELAGAPHVRDRASMGALYRKIGDDPSATRHFETAEAREVMRRVRIELMDRRHYQLAERR